MLFTNGKRPNLRLWGDLMADGAFRFVPSAQLTFTRPDGRTLLRTAGHLRELSGRVQRALDTATGAST
ncbi:MAG: hypothetical protein WBA12_01500 [Catalinimonas sp.]